MRDDLVTGVQTCALPILQSVDRIGGRAAWRVVTDKKPEDLDGLEFAWIICAHVKSNAIVLTNRAQSVGIGAGQMSRVDAAKVAKIGRAAGRERGEASVGR